MAANSYARVNERGFELATVGGNDYLLTGSKPVHITPNHRFGRRGDFSQTVNIAVTGKVDHRTAQQIANDSGRQARNAMRRNG